MEKKQEKKAHRPDNCPNIYKNGRLKTRAEMAEERKRFKSN